MDYVNIWSSLPFVSKPIIKRFNIWNQYWIIAWLNLLMMMVV